jgi:hypothetical protein
MYSDCAALQARVVLPDRRFQVPTPSRPHEREYIFANCDRRDTAKHKFELYHVTAPPLSNNAPADDTDPYDRLEFCARGH